MDKVVTEIQSLVNQVDVVTHPATKYAVPLIGAYLGAKVLGTFWRRFLGPLVLGEVKWREMGDWAVIAGASYGIGAEYAKELAQRGMNIFIIGHDETGIKEVETELKSKFP